MNLKIKRIPTTPLVDVFQNDGWETWTRLLWKNKKLIPLQGATLSDDQLSFIKDSLTK